MNQRRRFVRFNAVGAAGIGVQLSVLWLLTGVAHLHYLPATFAAVTLAVMHNFMWHRRWTWGDRPVGVHPIALFTRRVRFTDLWWPAWVGCLSHIALDIVSAFRSADYQLGIVRGKVERGLLMNEILRVSAAPGYSEHHSGRAVDLTTPGYAALEEEFERSPAFAWLKKHAKRFGFALSYPRRNRHGIAYEPWHWCWHAGPRGKR